MRTLCLITFGCLVGLIIFNYDLKLQTKALEVKAAKLASEIQDESDFLALMRAEVSHLSRPDRIDKMARSVLDFQPISPAQTVPMSAVLPGKQGDWQPEIAAARPIQRKDGIAALIDRTAGAASRPSKR